MLDDRAPQDQHIDAGITARRSAHCAAGRGRAPGLAPRLDPRHAARLQLGDDPAGDFVIEVARGSSLAPVRSPPARTAARCGGMVCLLIRPKPHGPPPEAGVGGEMRPARPGTMEADTEGRNGVEHPGKARGLAAAATGLEGSAARTRLQGKANRKTPPRSGVHQGGVAGAKPPASGGPTRPKGSSAGEGFPLLPLFK